MENQQLSIDEIDIIQIVKTLWQGKWIIIVVTIVFGIGSIIYSKSLPNIYISEALLAPVLEKKDGMSQLGGLAALAGINVGGGGGVDKTAVAMETLKSREFLNIFINKQRDTESYEIMPLLMAVKGWDLVQDKPIYDDTIYQSSTKKWVENGKIAKPSIQMACKSLQSLISINVDSKTKMVRISVEFFSPQIARQWTTWLVADINAIMKQRDLEEAQKSISYLEEQISKTNITDVRSVIYQLIE